MAQVVQLDEDQRRKHDHHGAVDCQHVRIGAGKQIGIGRARHQHEEQDAGQSGKGEDDDPLHGVSAGTLSVQRVQPLSSTQSRLPKLVTWKGRGSSAWSWRKRRATS